MSTEFLRRRGTLLGAAMVGALFFLERRLNRKQT
jgi:hypothetical protein